MKEAKGGGGEGLSSGPSVVFLFSFVSHCLFFCYVGAPARFFFLWSCVFVVKHIKSIELQVPLGSLFLTCGCGYKSTRIGLSPSVPSFSEHSLK